MANAIEAGRSLAHLRSLPEGWDYGRGGPISKQAYLSGATLLKVLPQIGAAEFDVVPGEDGSAVLIAYREEKSAEINCRPDGQFDLLHEIDDKDEQFAAGLSLAGLFFALEGFGWKSPRFYASCIRNATFLASEDTPVLPFGILPGVVYRSSARIASPQTIVGRANTSANSTAKTSAVTHQSSGEFRSLAFPMALA